MKMVLPSIAGAVSSCWAKHFDPFVTERLPNGLPKKGSFGISYAVNEDLAALFTRCDGDKTAMKKHLLASYKAIPPAPGFSTGVKPLSGLQADILIDFYLWAASSNQEFLLRKGKKTLGVYRKTAPYNFDADPQKHYYHRISYEFDKEATAQQKAAITGAVPPTVVWV